MGGRGVTLKYQAITPIMYSNNKHLFQANDELIYFFIVNIEKESVFLFMTSHTYQNR